MKLAKLLLIVFFTLFAFSEFTEDVVKTKAKPTKTEIKSGEEFDIQVDLSIADWWYTYGLVEKIGPDGIGPLPTNLLFIDEQEENFEIVGEIVAPKPKTKFDDGFDIDIDYYNGDISFVVHVKANKDIDLASDSSFITLDIQVCDTTSCLPPSYVPVYIDPDNKISEAAALFVPSDKLKNNKDEAVIESSDAPVTESNKEIQDAKDKGILSYLILSMIAGLGALGTPCVFPMIPITVSFFTKRAEKPNARTLTDALLFMFGIILTFTLLGVILTLILGATGVSDIATNPWANMVVASVFLILAFNLFGSFEIQMPTSMMNYLNTKSSSSGRLGIIIMGIVFSLTSFTCTVPFVGASLQSTASSGDLLYPIIGMIGFSFVFSIPFFFFALFPSMIKKLPKSGGWMNNLKVTLGFLEVAAAIKFISNVDLAWGLEIFTRDVFLSLWVACGVVIVMYLLGLFRMTLDLPIPDNEKPYKIGGVRALIVVFFASVAIYLFTGLFGKNLGEIDAYLPPAEYGTGGQTSSVFNGNSSSGSEKIKWMKDYQKAADLAKKEGKPLFIDFTGWQCTNCRWMEKNRFTDPQIADLLSQMVTVKLYTDRRKEPELSNKQLQIDKFKSIELPLYVVQNPDGEPLGTKAFTRDREEFIAFLKKGL